MPSLPAILNPTVRDISTRAVELLRCYYGLDGTRPFTGSRFELLGGGGDVASTANVITAEDIVSLSTLSIRVYGAAALRLLEDDQFTNEVTGLLAQIPTDLDLVEVAPELLANGSPANRLWRQLDGLYQFGPTTISKLMARKRPRLIPVYDSVIERAFSLGSSAMQWDYWHEALAANNQQLQKHLLFLRSAAGLPERISALRILDVVTWMEHRRTSEPVDEAVALPLTS